MKHSFYIFDLKKPWKRVQLVQAEVKVCEKFTWAIRDNGRRHLIGATAFYSLPSACRAHLTVAKKCLKNLRFIQGYYSQKDGESPLEVMIREYEAGVYSMLEMKDRKSAELITTIEKLHNEIKKKRGY